MSCTFTIDPPVRLAERGAIREVRSLSDARSKVRRYTRRTGDFIAMRLMSLLDNARTTEQAELAAQAFRHWAIGGQIASQNFSKRNARVGTARKASQRQT
jgi:hypothetical protein